MALTRLSPPPDIAPGDILVVGCLRNEALRLPDFLAHHRRLGVDRFLLIDNASDDGSTEHLRAQSDVSLYGTQESYSAGACGIAWQNELLAAHACGHWVLIVDIDELFVFPGCEDTPLATFLAWAEGAGADAAGADAAGADAVVAPMLDMYPAGPIAEARHIPGAGLITSSPWFDGGGYVTRRIDHGLAVPDRGGPRRRLFWDGRNRGHPAPLLFKIPLLKWRADRALTASTHVQAGAITAPTTGMLLHFKFLQDFAPAVLVEAARGEHFAGARQYAAYADVMAADPALSAQWAGSVRYRDSRQLVELGLMHAPDDYPFW